MRIRAGVTPPDSSPLEYAWAVTNAPESARYGIEPSGATTLFTAEIAGTFDLQVRVVDREGRSISRSFSTRVNPGRVFNCLRQPVTLDFRFLEVARRVPQFGGAYLNDEESLVLVLTNTAPEVAAAAEAAVRDIIGADRPLPSGRVTVVQGDYGFERLMANRVRARETLALPGVVSVGVDKRRNRVSIGVEDIHAQRAVGQELENLGVERSTVLVEITTPFARFEDEGRYRPVKGGIQIQRDGGFDLPHALCTLGFVADRNAKRGYITNSHCTNTQGNGEGTIHAQPKFANQISFPSTDVNKIGTVIADPPYFTGGDCPKFRECRFSDSSFSALAPGVGSQRGEIIQWPDSFRVMDTIPYPLDGQLLSKVGRTTGYNNGKVTDTCKDVRMNDTNFIFFCQDMVKAHSDHGDSGSPVFREVSEPFASLMYPDVVNPVWAAGILWGGDGKSFVFSNMKNLQHDLGKVAVTFSNDPPSISILKPTPGEKIFFGGFQETLLQAKADDTQDGPDCCTVTWKSNIDGDLGTGNPRSFLFTTPGTRTITAMAKNSFGNSKSNSVTVSTEIFPPKVTIAKPSAGQTFWTNQPYTFNGWAWDSQVLGMVPCNLLTWTTDLGDSFSPVINWCKPEVKFPFAGDRQLTLTAKSPWPEGASAAASVGFSVVNPQGLVASILNPGDGAHFWFPDPTTVTLVGSAQDPNPSATLTYTWILQQGTSQQVIGTTTGPSGVQTTMPWQPGYPPSGSYSATIILQVTGPSGTVTESVEVHIHGPIS